MLWIFVFIMGFFLFIPLWGLLSQFSLNAFSETLREPAFQKSLSITLLTAIGGSAISVLLALFFARQFATYNWRGKRLQRLCLLLPYLIPNFVLAIAFVISWNPTTGLLNFIFKFPFGLYGLTGMTILFAIGHLPVAFLLLEEKLRRIDPSLIEAARLSGANGRKIFFQIESPLLTPAILSALGLCFALNISAFAIPAWIGAPARVYALTYKVYQAIQVGGLDGLSEAATYALCLFLFAFIPLILSLVFKRQEKKYVLLSGKSSKMSRATQMRSSFALFQGFFLFTQLAFWAGPLFCLFLSTVTKPGCLQSEGWRCLSDISFSRYHYVLFELAETNQALKGSLFYGAIASFLTVFLSAITLLLLSRHPRRLKTVEALYSIPLSTPGAIIALGLIVIYSGRYGINLYNTAGIVVMAFVIKYLNLAFQPLLTGFGNISFSLIEAARLSGGTERAVWQKIVFPILQPEILGAFFLVFIPIVGELTMSIFLTSSAFKNIGTVLFDLQDYADQASAGALAILLIVMVLALNESAYRLSHGKLGY